MSFLAPKIVYVTCCDNGLYGLRHLHSMGVTIERVITISPELGDRYSVSGYADPSVWCKSVGVAVTSIEDYTIRVSDVENTSKELLLVNGWNRLISSKVIDEFKLGALGVHAGHPPIGHGRSPLTWNIIKGNKDLEVYVFKLTSNADDGNIIALQPVEITNRDNVATLYEKVMFQSAILLQKSIQLIAKGGHGYAQARQFEVVYPKRAPDDGLIDFRQTLEQLVDFVRAQSRPYPGAFSFLEGVKWNIWDAQPFDSFAFRDIPRVPGKILAALPSGVIVQTGTTPLWITEATAEGQIVLPNSLSESELLVGKFFS